MYLSIWWCGEVEETKDHGIEESDGCFTCCNYVFWLIFYDLVECGNQYVQKQGRHVRLRKSNSTSLYWHVSFTPSMILMNWGLLMRVSVSWNLSPKTAESYFFSVLFFIIGTWVDCMMKSSLGQLHINGWSDVFQEYSFIKKQVGFLRPVDSFSG